MSRRELPPCILGTSVHAELVQCSAWWRSAWFSSEYSGKVVQDGQQRGYIKVRREGAAVVSNFKKAEDESWGNDMIASKKSLVRGGLPVLVAWLSPCAFRFPGIGRLERRARACWFSHHTIGSRGFAKTAKRGERSPVPKLEPKAALRMSSAPYGGTASDRAPMRRKRDGQPSCPLRGIAGRQARDPLTSPQSQRFR